MSHLSRRQHPDLGLNIASLAVILGWIAFIAFALYVAVTRG